MTRILSLLLVSAAFAGCGDSSPDPRPGEVLATSDLQVAIRDNGVERGDGLSGIGALSHRANNVYAFTLENAGLNYEHVMSGHEDPRNGFTPRSGSLTPEVHGRRAVLHRRAEDSPWGVEATITYEVVDPHYVDMTFDGPALVPGERRQAAIMEQWVSVCIDYLARPVMGRFVVQYVLAPMLGREPDRKIIDDAIPEIRNLLGVVYRSIDGGPYLQGATPYIGDFLLVTMLAALTITPEGPGFIDEAPKVKRLLKAFSERPSFAATVPERFREAA